MEDVIESVAILLGMMMRIPFSSFFPTHHEIMKYHQVNQVGQAWLDELVQNLVPTWRTEGDPSELLDASRHVIKFHQAVMSKAPLAKSLTFVIFQELQQLASRVSHPKTRGFQCQQS